MKQNRQSRCTDLRIDHRLHQCTDGLHAMMLPNICKKKSHTIPEAHQTQIHRKDVVECDVTLVTNAAEAAVQRAARNAQTRGRDNSTDNWLPVCCRPQLSV